MDLAILLQAALEGQPALGEVHGRGRGPDSQFLDVGLQLLRLPDPPHPRRLAALGPARRLLARIEALRDQVGGLAVVRLPGGRYDEVLAPGVVLRDQIEGLLGDVDEARLATVLHLARLHGIEGPDVELPLPKAQQARQDRARVDADAHVDVDVSRLPDRLDDLDHAQAHQQALHRMVLVELGQATDAIVAIAEQFDPKTGVLLGQLVEAPIELV